MTRPRIIYESVTYADGSYVMTEADFPEGCHTRMTGRGLVGVGNNKLGIRVKLPLNVRLCNGCDGIIVDRHCGACELVFVDEFLDCGADPLRSLEPKLRKVA